MLKLCLTVILLGCATQINCSTPVFMWGQKTPSYLPALNKLNGEEFVTLVKSQAEKETLTVVFVEKSLSVEDLSHCKLKTKACYENLRKVVKKTFLNAVEDPVKALEASFSKQSQKSVSLSNDGKLSDNVDGNEKILFVYFDGAETNEDRANNDKNMIDLYNTLSSEREVTAVFTSDHSSFEYSKLRKRREAEAAEAKPEAKPEAHADAKPEAHADAVPKIESRQDTPVTEETPQRVIDTQKKFLIAFNSLSVNGETIDITSVTLNVNETQPIAHELGAELVSGDHKIKFNLVLSGGTWYAKTFEYNGNRAFANVPVSAYQRKSFGCGDLRLVRHPQTAASGTADHILIGAIQMQPSFDEEDVPAFSSHHNDCVGFFSPAIWGATFVVILLLSIMSWGLMMIMDIRTMDRFDDPKGKTITINAQE